jgi:hypothetical protein
MAKRFIDTNYFDDPFILSLKKDEKMLYIYLWTQCDHAGIFEINERLGNFHLDIKDYKERVNNFYKQFPEKLSQLDCTHFILMNFCKRQYPGGVNTNVRQISGAISILNSWNIEIINNQTFTLRVNNSYEQLKGVTNSYVNVNGIGNDIKEVKNENLIDRQKSFESEVLTFESKYDFNILKAFYNYWSEPTLDKKKMKKELQKTWDTKRRLNTWFENDKSYKK